VRVCFRDLNNSSSMSSSGLRSRIRNTTEGVLGLWPALSGNRRGEAGSSDQQVNSTPVSVGSNVDMPAMDSTSGEKDFDSGVPAGDSENVRGRHDSVKAPQGTEKAHGEFASSALKRRRS
jgi:hypothetical protein